MTRFQLIAASVLFLSASIFAIRDTTTAGTQPADSASAKTETAAVATDSTKNLTLEELAKYNGKNGMPAYVAADGVIYDVTGIEAWKSGKHKGGSVGTDISNKIKSSPHGAAVLKKRKVVGKLVTK